MTNKQPETETISKVEYDELIELKASLTKRRERSKARRDVKAAIFKDATVQAQYKAEMKRRGF